MKVAAFFASTEYLECVYQLVGAILLSSITKGIGIAKRDFKEDLLYVSIAIYLPTKELNIYFYAFYLQFCASKYIQTKES